MLVRPLIALAVGGAFVVLVGLGAFGFFTVVVFAGALLYEGVQHATALTVDHRGITLSPSAGRSPSVLVPWSSVSEVVVGAGSRVGVRLLPGAPLPRGIGGLVTDPARPQAVQPALVRTAPGLDERALKEVVTAYGRRVADGGSI